MAVAAVDEAMAAHVAVAAVDEAMVAQSSPPTVVAPETPSPLTVVPPRPPPVRKQKPNEPCQCGSQKKFKKCCGTGGLAPADQLEQNMVTVVGRAPGPLQHDHLMVKFPHSETPVAVPLSQLCKSRSHAEALRADPEQKTARLPQPPPPPER